MRKKDGPKIATKQEITGFRRAPRKGSKKALAGQTTPKKNLADTRKVKKRIKLWWLIATRPSLRHREGQRMLVWRGAQKRGKKGGNKRELIGRF